MRDTCQIKILIVAESIDVEDSSGTKGRVALINNLYALGYQLKVLHYTRKNILLSGIECVAIEENRSSFLFVLSRIERQMRYRLKIDIHNRLEKVFGFSFTLFNDRNSITKALNKETEFNPDLVITFSMGGSFRPHHALLKLPHLHSKWLAYIHDPYPMHLYPRPYAWVEPGHYQKWIFMKEMAEKAKHVAFPSKLLLEWMGSYIGTYLEKGVVIPHQIGAVSEDKVEMPDYFDPRKFNLLHAGNLLHARNPKGLLDAFELFLKRNEDARENVQLSFIGRNSFHSSLLKDKAKKIPQIFFKGTNISFEKINLLQHKASVNVILEAKSETSPFLPGKFPHCVAADRPILLLGPYYSETRRLLGENYPYWTEIDEVEIICKFIESLYYKWLNDKDKNLRLNRPDLVNYLSQDTLKITIDELINKE